MAIFLFLKMAAGHLGFWYRSKMALRTLRTVHVYHHAKFGDSISNGGRVITIFRFSKWRPAAILNFVVAQKCATARCGLSMATRIPSLVKISHIAAELWRFSFFHSAALDFDTGQKWRYDTLRTVRVSRHIWWQYLKWRLSYYNFLFFQNGGRPPSWILILVKNGVTARCRQSMSITLPNFVTVRQLAAELSHFVEKFKMAAQHR